VPTPPFAAQKGNELRLGERFDGSEGLGQAIQGFLKLFRPDGMGEALLHPETQGLPELFRGNFLEIQIDGGVAGISRGFLDPLVQLRLVLQIFQKNDVGPGIHQLRQLVQTLGFHHRSLLGTMNDVL
jgi:hypothetical protein